MAIFKICYAEADLSLTLYQFMLITRQLTRPIAAESRTIGTLVRLWREARRDRLQFLLDLHGEAEDREYLTDVVLPTNQVWIAEVDGTVAGFITFADGWLNQLYVAPQFQRQGIGSDLLKVATQSQGTLQLWVFESNVPAIQFYERAGFGVVERTDGAANEAKMPDIRMQWNRQEHE